MPGEPLPTAWQAELLDMQLHQFHIDNRKRFPVATKTYAVVQGALDKLMVGRTSVVIAHHLTTVQNADKIAVTQRGVVQEEGTHDELMQRGTGGAYVQLARAQAGAQ